MIGPEFDASPIYRTDSDSIQSLTELMFFVLFISYLTAQAGVLSIELYQQKVH